MASERERTVRRPKGARTRQTDFQTCATDDQHVGSTFQSVKRPEPQALAPRKRRGAGHTVISPLTIIGTHA